MTKTIVKQTVTSGTGRNTRNTNIPTADDLRRLLALGFAAELVNIAPRGGVWGETLQVPARQAEKARRALAGEVVWASRAAERAAKAAAKARAGALAEAEANVIDKTTYLVAADAGSVKMAGQITPVGPYVRADQNGTAQIPNGYGDGQHKLTVVTVADADRRFSRHEGHGNRAPVLQATATGPLSVYGYDCGDSVFAVILSPEPLKIYSLDGRVYIVGTEIDITEIG